MCVCVCVLCVSTVQHKQKYIARVQCGSTLPKLFELLHKSTLVPKLKRFGGVEPHGAGVRRGLEELNHTELLLCTFAYALQ